MKDVYGVIAAVIFAVMLMLVWRISTLTGASIDTVIKSMIGSGLFCSLTLAAIYARYKGYMVATYTLPILSVLIWWSLTPVLNDLAGVKKEAPLQFDVAFYGTSSFQVLIALILLLGGYALIYWRRATRW